MAVVVVAREAGWGMHRRETVSGLRRVWAVSGRLGQAAVAMWKNYGSDERLKMGPELDTGMVLAVAEEGKRDEILQLVAPARCPCYMPTLALAYTRQGYKLYRTCREA